MADYLDTSAGLRARVALDKYAFKTVHSLGQNFILDDAFLCELLDAADIRAEENVLEIGPGAGVMTSLLADRAQRVLAVELDRKLEPVLREVLAPHENVQLVFEDFMRADVSRLVGDAFGDAPYRVVANLPYYITADILLKLVNCARKPERICIMVQKEAAERILSEPGEKQWCALAATIRYYGQAEILAEVPPHRFVPMPHVTSCLIQIERYAAPVVRPGNEALFHRVIQAAFAMRRKTLCNNLKMAFSIPQAQALEALKAAGLDEKIRGECLSLQELCRVSDALVVHEV